MAFRLPEKTDVEETVVMLHGTVLTAAEEQKKWLTECLVAVNRKAGVMRVCIEKAEDMSVIIRAAAQMLDELRTNLLEPQNYYELYMKVFTAMEGFVAYLADEHRAGRHTLEEMYERVQFCGYIVPRLYLLIAAGAVYIDAGDQPALEIARDLVEMCKGVQHPTRGLFLRHFLLTMMKGKLPGDPSWSAERGGNGGAAAAGENGAVTRDGGGTVADTASLLVHNFKEMNWLWIRMEAGSYVNRNGGSTNSVASGGGGSAAPGQAPAPASSSSSPPGSATTRASDRAGWDSRPSSPRTPLGSPQRSLRAARRTQQERRAMCVLVGMNVVRVSQLEGLTCELYSSTILPQLLSIMVRYCEPLAQQYLFEILIQVFPDEFHLFTIDKLFDAISRTVAGVEVSELLRSLMDRLCKYAMAVQDGVTDVSGPEEEAKLRDLFPMLLNQMSEMPVSYRTHMIANNVIKRTSSVPPPTPMLLGAYVTTMRHLAGVALTLYGKSAKRRCMAVANVVDVIAAKFTATAAAPAEGEAAAGKDEAAAAASGPVSISPAAALAASQFLVHLITECCATVQEALAMEGIATLAACLPFLERREVAVALCETALRGSTAAPLLPTVSKSARGGSTTPVPVAAAAAPRPITALEDVARVFELMDPILVDQPDTPSDEQLIYRYNPAVEFVDEQNLVCRMLHLLTSDDPAVYVKMLTGARKLLLQGGARRIPLTYPTLIALHRRAALRLYAQYRKESASSAAHGGAAAAAESAGEEAAAASASASASPTAAAAQAMKGIRKCLSHVYSGDSKGILEVYAVEVPIEALKEFLLCASTADVCEQPETSYELYAEALTLYETHVEDTREQIDVIVAFVNALYSMRNMAEENYEVLAAKVCQYASKMLKKRDQSHLIAVCAALFAKKQLSHDNQKRVQECLRRALKLAGQVLALPQLHLYVQLLNVFLHFFTAKSGYLVTVDLVNELVEKITEVSEVQRVEVGNGNGAAGTGDEGGAGDAGDAAAAESDSEVAATTFAEIRLVYRNITKYIRSRQSAEERWGEIEV